MNSYPLISVIIPVYNVEEYLAECLNSVINQTYKNLEIIAIDDGSTDGSYKILKNYEQKEENIKVISQKNSGQSVARNLGLKLAKGKYIYFLDSDDYLSLNTFERLIKKMEENSLDIIRFAAEPFVENFNFKVNKGQYDYSHYFIEGKVYNRQEFLEINIKAFTPSPVLFIIRKDILTKNNIEFKPGIIHEDELFTLIVFLNINSAMYDSGFYYKRRYREGSTMTSNNYEKKSYDSRCTVLHELNQIKTVYNNSPEVDLINSRIRNIYRTVALMYDELDPNYKKNKIKNISGIRKIDSLYYFAISRTRKYYLPIKKVIKILKKGLK